jgi:hypothetical protein
MERCVISLDQCIELDIYFNDDLNIRSLFQSAFYSSIIRPYNSTTTNNKNNNNNNNNNNNSNSNSNDEYNNLLRETIKKAVRDLRDASRLIHHFIHLCSAVQFVNKFGVIHHDIKLGNIFIRVTNCDENQVNDIQFVLGDFDCAHVFPIDINNKGLKTNNNDNNNNNNNNNNNSNTKKIQPYLFRGGGTVGYRTCDYAYVGAVAVVTLIALIVSTRLYIRSYSVISGVA